jgi:hypothetical protein
METSYLAAAVRRNSAVQVSRRSGVAAPLQRSSRPSLPACISAHRSPWPSTQSLVALFREFSRREAARTVRFNRGVVRSQKSEDARSRSHHLQAQRRVRVRLCAAGLSLVG